ncbi:ABC transporter ATP-binding protein [Flaviaesturariibacter amylovorans]|uniref:ABC transporter ATP-binding protein n=1 Tax=Flaviaesturariibacter amylovorans TaxID=1084520 RepID=A0ABP8GGW3_9BACT
MTPPLLHIQDLSVRLGTGPEAATVVRNMDLQIRPGELLALVGESGSGKSVSVLSILRLMPEAITRYTGRILFRDGEKEVDLLQLPVRDLQALRGNRIAMIFQEPMTALNPVLNCGRQVAEVLQQHRGLSRKAALAEATEWFRKVRLPHPESIGRRYPHQLSGGQKQRVMIAMALCCRPALLLCDEPTTALDVTVQKTILELIKELQQELGMAVLFITHDLGVVADIADRIAILYRGDLLEVADKHTLLQRPQHPYTRALLACRPALHPKGAPLPLVADFLEGKERPTEQPAAKAPAASEVLLRARGLTVQFPTRTNLWGRTLESFTAVDQVDLDLYRGETLGLVGESGCGKTTLGRTLLRLVEPTSGTIALAGQDLLKLDRKQLRSFRRNVQLVFQDPFSSLNPRLTIADALEEPLQVQQGLPGRERRQRVRQLLDQVGLPEDAGGRYPHAFSGGQRQRIVIARALALNPSLLVCDESVSALDVSVQAQVLNLLNDLRRELGLTLLFISHDLSVVRYMSDRIAVMQAGRIVELGDAEAVYHNPAHPYTQTLLEALPGRSAFPGV